MWWSVRHNEGSEALMLVCSDVGLVVTDGHHTFHRDLWFADFARVERVANDSVVFRWKRDDTEAERFRFLSAAECSEFLASLPSEERNKISDARQHGRGVPVADDAAALDESVLLEEFGHTAGRGPGASHERGPVRLVAWTSASWGRHGWEFQRRADLRPGTLQVIEQGGRRFLVFTDDTDRVLVHREHDEIVSVTRVASGLSTIVDVLVGRTMAEMDWFCLVGPRRRLRKAFAELGVRIRRPTRD